MPRPRSNRRLWFAAATLVLIGLAAAIWGLRDTQGQIERRVEAILQGARKSERRNLGALEWLVYSLPDPLSRWSRRLISRQVKGDSDYEEALVKLGTNAVPVLLLAVESDGSPAARRISVMALAEFRASSAVPVMTNALIRDKDPEVRRTIASALTTMEDKTAIPVLRTVLRNDSVNYVRAESASTLAALGGADVVPDLLAVSRVEKDWWVRSSLASAFGELKCAKSVPVLTGWLKEQPTPPTVGNSAPQIMVPSVPDYQLRDVILALGQIGGEAAYQALAERWGTESATTVRQALCQAFGDMGDRRALPLLLDALHQDAVLDSSIAEALGNLGDASAVDSLLSLLNDGGPDVRPSAAAALGRLGSLRSVPSLKHLLEQYSDPTVRNSVFEALGMIGDPTAHEVILKVMPQLGDGREEAVWALGHLRSTNSIAALAKALKDDEHRVRFAAAYALVEIGGAAAADALAANLSDADEIARLGKACALTMLGRTNGLALVRKGLRAKLDWQRFSAALALVRYKGAVEAGELKPMLEDRVPTLRRFGSEAVVGRAVPALVEMLRDTNKDYRQYAARGLMFMEDPSALPALREACHDTHPTVRDAARLAVRFIERAEPSRN